MLFREFTPEITHLGSLSGGKWRPLIEQAQDILQIELIPETNLPRFKMGGFGEGTYNHSNGSSDNTADVHLHSQAGFFFKDYLTLYNNIRLFNNGDSNYIGEEYKDFSAFNEQAYISYDGGWIRAKLGRDFLQLGPGRSGQLLISDNSRPFDMYHIRLGNRTLQFSSWGMWLNQRAILDTTLTVSAFGNAANRYLNGHRLSLNITGFSSVSASGFSTAGRPASGTPGL